MVLYVLPYHAQYVSLVAALIICQPRLRGVLARRKLDNQVAEKLKKTRKLNIEMGGRI